MPRRNIVLAALGAVLIALFLSSPALAHSRLTGSTPESGAKLATPPSTVVMTFNEGAQAQFSTFTVIDRARKHYETSDPPQIDAANGTVTVALQPDMPAGAYTVQWKVVSAVDGHLTRGSFVFTVLPQPTSTPDPNAPKPTVAPTEAPVAGATPVPATPTVEEPTPEPTIETPVEGDGGDGSGSVEEAATPGPQDVIVRWLGYLLMAIVVGGAGFALLVVPAAMGRLGNNPDTAKRLDRRFSQFALIAAVLLLLTLGAEIVLQGARAAELGPLDVLGQGSILSAVLGSTFGMSVTLRALAVAVIAVVLLGALLMRRGGPLLWGAIVLLGVGYYFAQTLSGHGTAISQEAGAGLLQKIAPYADVVHLLATAFWIGGIFYFVVVLLPLLISLPADSRSAFLGAGVGNFSRVAIWSVLLLIISGVLNFLGEQPSVETTLNTTYGQAVIAKVVLLALLAIPALINLRRIGPGLQQLRGKLKEPGQSLISTFRNSIRVEAVLIAVVLIFSALLTLNAPATDTSAFAAAPTPTTVAEVIATATEPPAATATAAPTTAPGEPTAEVTQTPTVAGPLNATLALSQTVRGVDVELTTEHAENDVFTVRLSDANGQIGNCAPTPDPNADCALDVRINLTQLEDRTTDVLLAYDDDGDGSFVVPEAPYLALDGNWQLVVMVRRYNQPDDIQAAFRYNLTESSLTGRPSDYYRVLIKTNPDPPVSGPVDLIFTISDGDGNQITDATVTVQGIMPVHGHITDEGSLEKQADGTYKGTLLMPMSGAWTVELGVERADGDVTVVEASLDLGQSDYDLTPYPSPNIDTGG